MEEGFINSFTGRVEVLLRAHPGLYFSTADIQEIEDTLSFGLKPASVTSSLSNWWNNNSRRRDGFHQVHVSNGSGRKAYCYTGRNPIDRREYYYESHDDEPRTEAAWRYLKSLPEGTKECIEARARWYRLHNSLTNALHKQRRERREEFRKVIQNFLWSRKAAA